MSESQKDRYIDYLADCVTNPDLDKRVMELVFEDFFENTTGDAKDDGDLTGGSRKASVTFG